MNKKNKVDEAIKKLPFLKKVIFYTALPFFYLWYGFCWCVMKLGHGLYVAGDWLSGWYWDGHNWTEEL